MAQVAHLPVSVPACSPVKEEVNANANANAGTTDTAVPLGGPAGTAQPEPLAKPKPRQPSRYLWAALIARIYEAFPLICPHCDGQMRIIAFVALSGRFGV